MIIFFQEVFPSFYKWHLEFLFLLFSFFYFYVWNELSLLLYLSPYNANYHCDVLVVFYILSEFWLVGSKRRGFSALAPTLWNMIPPEVRCSHISVKDPFSLLKEPASLALPIGLRLHGACHNGRD